MLTTRATLIEQTFNWNVRDVFAVLLWRWSVASVLSKIIWILDYFSRSILKKLFWIK